MLKLISVICVLSLIAVSVDANCGLPLPKSDYCLLTNKSANVQGVTDFNCGNANSNPITNSHLFFGFTSANCTGILQTSGATCQNAFTRYYCSYGCIPCQTLPICQSVCNDLFSACPQLQSAGCLSSVANSCTSSSTCFEVQTMSDSQSSSPAGIITMNSNYLIGLIAFFCLLFVIF
jgi:hypothetical protein